MPRLLPLALLVVAACDNGVSPENARDAAPPDTAAPMCDTTQPAVAPTPAPPGTVQVTVAVGGHALADAVVIAHGADGTPHASAHTDAHGAALVAIEDGDAITAIGGSAAWTVEGVASGDVLALGDSMIVAPATSDGTITVDLPPRPDGATMHVRAQGGFALDVGSDTPTIEVPVPTGASGMWLVGIEDPIGDLPQMWSAIACAPTSGEIAMPDLLGMTQLPVALRGIPDGATAAGVQLDDFRALTGAPVDGAITGTAAFPILVPGTAATWWASQPSGAIVRGSVPVAPDARALDLAPRWLPWLTGVHATGRVISWSSDGTGETDAVLARFTVGATTWQVLAPADSAVTLPQVPGISGDPVLTDFALLAAPGGGYPALRVLAAPDAAPGVITSR